MARFTLGFDGHVIDVLKNVRSITHACALLKIVWATADRIIERGVAPGLERSTLEDLSRVGTVGSERSEDSLKPAARRASAARQKSSLKGHCYITALNDLGRSRVPEVVEGRSEEDGLALLRKLHETSRATIKAVAMDTWQAFENAARRVVRGGEIVHDKFHISKHLNAGVNWVSTEELRRQLREGDDRLKGTRWLWMRAEDNLTDAQYESFRDINDAALRTSKAWFVKKAVRIFSVIPKSSAEAAEYFDECYRHRIYRKLEPMKSVSRMLKERFGNEFTW
jgi:transposase